MLRAFTHIGLSALLVIAPTLCCCNVRLLTGCVVASEAAAAACPTCPQPVEPSPSCCHVAKAAEKASCCREAEPARTDSKPAAPKPTAPAPAKCVCFPERLAATAPEGAPTVAAPEPTGELLPFAILGPVALPPKHLGLLGGLQPPERAGVDARSAALFERHVLRC